MSVPNQLSYSNTRSTSVVKSYFSKPMMFIIAALTIVGTILQFIASNESTGANSSSSGFPFGLLINAAVAVLLLLTFFSSKKLNANPGIFLGILHILSFIQLILFVFASLASMLIGLMLVINSSTILTFAFEHPETVSSIIDISKYDKDTLLQQIDESKIPLLIALLVMLIVLIIAGIFINSQTSFLRSCKRSCNGSALFYDGASTYGTLSMVFSFISLICIVITFMLNFTGEPMFEDMGVENSTATASVSNTALAYSLVTAITVFLRGTFAKGWINFAKENESYVDQGNVSNIARTPDSNPIATFKSTQRRSNDAIHQNQSYLYGETEDNNANKKSEYIPEELQNDYPPQQFDQQNMGGMMGDPFMGDPFAQPMQQNPYGQDPFAADPFTQSMGNPYGGANPNDQNYNNGLM